MPTKISSFAVLDLETASLPDLNFNKTNITEVSIHGFKADDFKDARSCSLPRTNHKLTLLFNPLMMIHPDSERITGLDNYMLEHESTFDKNAGSVIISFLKHLRQPVCLVAHNGSNFDFPVLKTTFAKLGMELPSDIFCLDSLPTIRDLDLAKEKEKLTELDSFIPLKAADFDFKVEVQQKAVLNNNDDNLGMAKEGLDIEDFTKSFGHSDLNDSKSNEETMKTPDKTDHQTDWQRFNETTPKRPPNVENIQRKRKRSIQDCSPVSTISKPNSRKSLFPSHIKTIGNYKLMSIYERLFGNMPVNAHHAEADVITLGKIMLKYGKAFVDYAEKNAKPFSEVKKLGAR